MQFPDIEGFQALPRLSGLALSPDGDRLVTCVSRLDALGQKWVSSLWEIDPAGLSPAHELTDGTRDDGSPTFTPGGELLFTSKASAAAKDEGEPETVELWSLSGRGQARQVGTRPGGVARPIACADKVVVTSDTLPGSDGGEDDARRRKARRDRKVNAILHRTYPVRHWDHDLGPGQNRLLVGTLTEGRVTWHDLTPAPARSLDEASFDVSTDGTFVVTTWSVLEDHGSQRTTLRRWDIATGRCLVLADDVKQKWGHPKISPDGNQVAAIRSTRSTSTDPGQSALVLLDSAGSTVKEIGGWDLWPTDLRWTPDGSALLVTADEQGRAPVFRVEGDQITRLTTDDGAYSDLCVSPDGSCVYALRSALDSPPTPVRIDAHVPGTPQRLPSPGADLDMPGTLTEVMAQAADGRPMRAWLAVPNGEGPHPTVLWIHGGPLSSWNSWSWRWCPWLLVAGHTDRFRAIVTHASLWDLARFGTTTDAGWYWAREMSPEMIAANDPRSHVGDIVTPMLVIHGDKDYRVPVGEALGLWWDLCSAWGDPEQMPHRFLYFPDENHWVLTPGHSVVWYETVLAFLDQHVLGRDEIVPELLS